MDSQRVIAIQATQNKKNENLIIVGDIKKVFKDKKVLKA